MDTDAATTIADLARRLDWLAAEVQALKALYADDHRRGALRSRAWREAYEQVAHTAALRSSENG